MDQPIASAFGEQAFAYRDYLAGPSGRLRQEITWRRLSAFLERFWNTASVPRSILDAGCGTGELALRLAQIGYQVVLLDPAEEMLSLAQCHVKALRPPPAFPPQFLQGAVEEATGLFEEGAFDLILCHFLVEYLPDPRPALAALRHILRPEGYLSLITVNRRQEPLRLAIRDQKFPEALEALTHTASSDSLFGVRRGAFEREELHTILQKAEFEVVEDGGIAIFIDYLAKEVINDRAAFESLLNLEEEGGKHHPWKDVARYLHLFARNTS
ncbi:putative Methyltransferase type 11 [Candidatus Methylomirabilis oxygeniifera]|uniref:Putative Methyltransferase type 11 n=1 Tax=Methylomirabilis oxygeniifera TaxID=671143 RepID=D5MKP1_METO1|nr:putative Methyltransferase type 11 [Candidatus Methylomirabilis oxyfera]